MGVAVTLCDETNHEHRENEHDYSFFGSSEAESLPCFIQFETPVPLQFLPCSFWRDRTIPLTRKGSTQHGSGTIQDTGDFKEW